MQGTVTQLQLGRGPDTRLPCQWPWWPAVPQCTLSQMLGAAEGFPAAAPGLLWGGHRGGKGRFVMTPEETVRGCVQGEGQSLSG